jgi:DNA anti-recombination protein RmuC
MLGLLRLRLTVKQRPAYMYGRYNVYDIQQRHLGVWESACSLAAAHPEVAVGVAAVVMMRSFQRELLLKEAAVKADEYIKREHELQQNIEAIEKLLEEERRNREMVMHNITHRGKLGENALALLLKEATERGYAIQFQLQPKFEDKQPDAVVELKGGRFMVLDSKAPKAPTQLLETGCEEARLSYVKRLKSHITDLCNKRYHAIVPSSLPHTWMILPTEGYLQAAYSSLDGTDDLQLHSFAAERQVALVGPNGLRSALKLWWVLQSEVDADMLMQDDAVREHLKGLQPLWTDTMLPRFRSFGKDLDTMIKRYMQLSEGIKAYDVALRDEKIWDLPKARKTQLPPIVKGLEDR